MSPEEYEALPRIELFYHVEGAEWVARFHNAGVLDGLSGIADAPQAALFELDNAYHMVCDTCLLELTGPIQAP